MRESFYFCFCRVGSDEYVRDIHRSSSLSLSLSLYFSFLTVSVCVREIEIERLLLYSTVAVGCVGPWSSVRRTMVGPASHVGTTLFVSPSLPEVVVWG